MFIKNLEKRICFRDIKCYLWVILDIINIIGWFDDFDLVRFIEGCKI